MEFAAVILAAGMSRRMGTAKALLDLGGKPLIRRLIDSVQAVEQITSIVVVTGHEPAKIQEVVSDSRISFAHNAAFDSGGMLSSVKVGAATVAGRCEAFFLMLLDQPLVQHQTMATMAQTWQERRPTVLAPLYEGQRGHPILIDAAQIPSILLLPQSATLRDFVERHREHSSIVEVTDLGVLSVVDTPADYQLILSQWQAMS